MRVTQGTIIRGYTKSLNRTIGQLAKSNQRLTTKRKFNLVSEDTAGAAKSFSIREQLYKNELYTQNIEDADGEITATENNIKSIGELLKTASEKMIESKTDTNGANRKIFANEIGNLKNQILKLVNSKYTDKYIFGGSGNGKEPFTVDDSGTLLFNGQSVLMDKPFPENINTFVDIGLGLSVHDGYAVNGKVSINGIEKNISAIGEMNTTTHGEHTVKITNKDADNFTATLTDVNGTEIEKIEFDKDDKSFVIGGVTIRQNQKFSDADTIKMNIIKKPIVDSSTAMNIKTSGIDVLDCGYDKDGFPNNIYMLLDEVQKTLEADTFDNDKMGKLLSAVQKGQEHIVINLTDIGTKTKFLEYNKEILDDQNITLQQARKKIEDVSVEEESIYNKVYESNWLMTLQLGTKIIPPSIFDFMR